MIRAKVPTTPPARPRRTVPGMKRCGKPNGSACPYIQTGKTCKATATNYKVDLDTGRWTVTLGTSYIIYTSYMPSAAFLKDVASSTSARLARVSGQVLPALQLQTNTSNRSLGSLPSYFWLTSVLTQWSLLLSERTLLDIYIIAYFLWFYEIETYQIF